MIRIWRGQSGRLFFDIGRFSITRMPRGYFVEARFWAWDGGGTHHHEAKSILEAIKWMRTTGKLLRDEERKKRDRLMDLDFDAP